MKSQPISEMSTKDLRKNYKTIRILTMVLSGLFVVMAFSSVYITINKGFGASSILPLVFLPSFIINITNLKKIKSELLARGETLNRD